MLEVTNDNRKLARYQSFRRAAISVIVLALSIITLFGRSTLPEFYHDRIETFGVMLILTGIFGRLWSTLYIDGRKSDTVVQTGPYSITRNPLYLFSAVAAAGVGAQLGSVVAGVGSSVLCITVFHFVSLREEGFLLARFGHPYEEYCSRVPRLFPDLRLYQDQELVTIRPRILIKTLLDGLVFFLALPFFEIVENLQEAELLPVLFRFW